MNRVCRSKINSTRCFAKFSKSSRDVHAFVRECETFNERELKRNELTSGSRIPFFRYSSTIHVPCGKGSYPEIDSLKMGENLVANTLFQPLIVDLSFPPIFSLIAFVCVCFFVFMSVRVEYATINICVPSCWESDTHHENRSFKTESLSLFLRSWRKKWLELLKKELCVCVCNTHTYTHSRTHIQTHKMLLINI